MSLLCWQVRADIPPPLLLLWPERLGDAEMEIISKILALRCPNAGPTSKTYGQRWGKVVGGVFFAGMVTSPLISRGGGGLTEKPPSICTNRCSIPASHPPGCPVSLTWRSLFSSCRRRILTWCFSRRNRLRRNSEKIKYPYLLKHTRTWDRMVEIIS